MAISTAINAPFEQARSIYRAGRYQEAAQLCAQLNQRAPRDWRPVHLIGLCQLAHGAPQVALQTFQKALRLDPSQPSIHADMASAHMFCGDLDKAEWAYRGALQRKKDHTGALSGLGDLLLRKGKPQEAYDLLRPMVDRESAKANVVMVCAAAASQIKRRDEAIELLGALTQSPSLRVGMRSMAHFRLGKELDRAGRYEEAFEQFQAGAEVKGAQFDADAFRAGVDQTIAQWTADRISAMPRASTGSSNKPILIVGMPRSGTTLIEQILASHSQVAAGGELPDIEQFVIEMHMHLRPVPQASVMFVQPEQLSQQVLNTLAGRYLKRLTEIDAIAAHVTDKLPPNFKFLGMIQCMLPECRVIHSVRNLLDVAVSCYEQEFYKANEWSYDLADIGTFMAGYKRLMAHWNQVLDLPMLDVVYEEVVADPEAQVRRMLEFLGLPWEDACMKFHESKRIAMTASTYQVRQPLYSSSVGRHKHYEKHLGPVKAALEGVEVAES